MDKVKNWSVNQWKAHLKELEVDQNKKFTRNSSKPKFQWPRRFLFFLHSSGYTSPQKTLQPCQSEGSAK